MFFNKLRFIDPDALGVFASTLCVFHCIGVPLLIAGLPLLFNATDASESRSLLLGRVTSVFQGSHAGSETSPAGDESCADEACCASPHAFWTHFALLGAVAPLGLIALGFGFWRHQSMGVLALGVIGVALLCAALAFGNELLSGRGEQIMSVTGSVCMITAHIWNKRACDCVCSQSGPESGHLQPLTEEA